MQRTPIILACFFICVNCFSQQYPFVHYTPKDGLISNQVKTIYQDSKGRLYFSSVNGLSIYDGSRFTNYTSKNGLNSDIVNCVMEMGDDSVWIITNSAKISCLVRGNMKTLTLKDKSIPIINHLSKDDKGSLYASTDQGLYLFEDDRFVKLPFIDTNNKDINSYISYALPVNNYLLIHRDYSLVLDQKFSLYLYNKEEKKIVSELQGIYSTRVAPDGRIWVMTEKKILSVDNAALKKGKIVLQELPSQFEQIKNLGGYFIHFDREGNCWLGNQRSVVMKAAPDGKVTIFNTASGLSMFYINFVFQDQEGTSWIATNNAGINKLVNSNFSLQENPVHLAAIFDINYLEKNHQLLLYSAKNADVSMISDNKQVNYKIKNASEILRFVETPYGYFGIGSNAIYKMTLKGNSFSPEIIFKDSADNGYSGILVDKNGNFVSCGIYYLSTIVNGKTIHRTKPHSFTDQAACDNKGNLWAATRDGELIMYQINPGNPSNYLEEKKVFVKELTAVSPRSIIIDKNDNIWIGTRNHGIHVFSLENGNLTRKFHLTTGSGLSDDFTTFLACDADNNVWACSSLGLDRISIKKETPVIENITKQNNIYQSVFKVVIDKNNTAWAAVSNGLIKITAEKKQSADYVPKLMLSMVKSGKDTIPERNNSTLSYKQNNISFYFAATSYLDEKQVLYSYRLQKGVNNPWSEPSTNAMVSFIGLQPGNYTLDVKATFPAGRYADQFINYSFSIAPPWWQTWWFRSLASLMIAGLVIVGFRFYYRRKLEKQLAILEKQQAIEKERTRIATDMHDDLGAGLSRIKFLSETIGIKKQQHQPIEDDIIKIREYSHEMIDKMGEIVWALNEKNDSLSDLLSYTRSYAMEYLSQNGIECKTQMPDSFPSKFVSGEFRRNIFLTIKEALHNIVKHSQATEVTLTIDINDYLSIKLKDDGIGFDKNTIRLYSNGLCNMESRIREIGGTIEIIIKEGTLINLSIPLNA